MSALPERSASHRFPSVILTEERDAWDSSLVPEERTTVSSDTNCFWAFWPREDQFSGAVEGTGGPVPDGVLLEGTVAAV